MNGVNDITENPLVEKSRFKLGKQGSNIIVENWSPEIKGTVNNE